MAHKFVKGNFSLQQDNKHFTQKNLTYFTQVALYTLHTIQQTLCNVVGKSHAQRLKLL
jgi:hypothetical protein